MAGLEFAGNYEIKSPGAEKIKIKEIEKGDNSMTVKEAIEKRRAYRSLEPFNVTKELISDLARCAQLTASCFNRQPWRFVFIYDPDVLKEMRKALSKGNAWAYNASMIIAVIGRREDDCIIGERLLLI